MVSGRHNHDDQMAPELLTYRVIYLNVPFPYQPEYK
jgi:hypothetical protein